MEIEDIGKSIKVQIELLREKYGIEVKGTVRLSTRTINVKIKNLPLLIATNNQFMEEEKKFQAKISLLDPSYKVVFMQDKNT